MVVDHIGLTVRSINKAIKHWEETFGYRQMTDVVLNSRQKVKVVFMEKSNSVLIKLIEPIDQTSAAYGHAAKGGGLHHLCFKCKDIDLEIEKMTKLGCRVLAEPQPGEAFENENIAFVFAKNGLNVELISTDKKAQKI